LQETKLDVSHINGIIMLVAASNVFRGVALVLPGSIEKSPSPWFMALFANVLRIIKNDFADKYIPTLFAWLPAIYSV